MYAIIRTGGKQTKVHEGDLIDVERLRAEGEVGFTPLLVVDDAGTVFSRHDDLKSSKVVARVVGESTGPKIDIFKYRAKTGYRRRQGHHQKYSTLEVVRIHLPAGGTRSEKVAASTTAAKSPKPSPAAAAKPAAEAKPVPKKAPAKAAAATRKTAARKPAAAAKAPARKAAPAPKAKASASPAKKAAPRKKES